MSNSLSPMARVKALADQTGLSTDEVQKLDEAAKKVGRSFEDFQDGKGRIFEVFMTPEELETAVQSNWA